MTEPVPPLTARPAWKALGTHFGKVRDLERAGHTGFPGDIGADDVHGAECEGRPGRYHAYHS